MGGVPSSLLVPVQLRLVMGEQQHVGLLWTLFYIFPLGVQVTEETLPRVSDCINSRHRKYKIHPRSSQVRFSARLLGGGFSFPRPYLGAHRSCGRGGWKCLSVEAAQAPALLGKEARRCGRGSLLSSLFAAGTARPGCSVNTLASVYHCLCHLPYLSGNLEEQEKFAAAA